MTQGGLGSDTFVVFATGGIVPFVYVANMFVMGLHEFVFADETIRD